MLGRWLRRWLRSPWLATQYILTIGVGMGTVVAVLSLMLALGYQPLPYHDSGQIVELWDRVESGAPIAALSGSELTDYSSTSPSPFAALGGFTVPPLWLVDERRGAAEVRTCDIEEAIFRELGIVPVLGRGVVPGDVPAGASTVAPAWISYRLWQARYGGSTSAIGDTLRLAQTASGRYENRYRVVGVMPSGASIPRPGMADTIDVWIILSSDIRTRAAKAGVFFGLGRLSPGISVTQAEAALAVTADRRGRPADRRNRPVVQSLEAISQGPARRTMGLLTLGIGLVFGLGLVNLASMMVSEGAKRRREISIRASLGATRSRLWLHVAAEQSFLTLLSLGLGVVIASVLLRLLTQLMPAAGLGPPLTIPPTMNVAVLFGFAAITLVAALLWSWSTVARGQQRARLLGLVEGGSSGGSDLRVVNTGTGRSRLVLLAGQTAIGVCLLAAATMAVRTYASFSLAGLGPAPRNTVLLSINPAERATTADAQAMSFDNELLQVLTAVPGMQSVALAESFPPSGSPVPFRKSDDLPDAARESTSPFVVSDGFFRTLGIPILFGRGFESTDRYDGEPVAIIDIEMASRNWTSPPQAVNAEIFFGATAPKRYRIIGVSANFGGYWTQKPAPTIYLSEAQVPSAGGVVVVRATGAASAVPEFARQQLQRMSVPAVLSDASTMEGRWQATVTRPRARMACMLLLALVGLGLSIQGVYSAALATASARRHELAVRSAIGASAGWLAWHVTHRLLLAVLVGAAIGGIGALGLEPLLDQWIGSMVTNAFVPVAIAILLLVMAAAVACYAPARAAVRANPIDALRRG